MFEISHCPASGQERVNFHSGQEKPGQDPGVILYHPMIYTVGRGEGVPSGQVGVAVLGSAWWALAWKDRLPLLYAVTHICCCYPSFLISILCQVSCSYHNPCSLPYEPSILLFIPLRGLERLSKQHIVQNVSVRALYWRITSLSHNNYLFEHNSLTHLP